MKQDAKTIFPDTNILLHYPPIDQIDWPGWCKCKSAKIVLCLQVIDELDGKKDDLTMGERAKKTIKKIKEVSSKGGNIKDGVLLELYSRDLNNIDISVDEVIIKQVLDYRSNHQDEDIYIMSEDLGMQLRCGQRIKTIEPDKKKRQQSPKSKLQKENIKLKNQIAKLQNQAPALALILTQPEEDVTDSPEPFRVINYNAVYFKDENDVIREELGRCNAPPAGTSQLVTSMFSTPDYSKYRQKLSEWVEKYNEAMEELARSFDFSLHIKNAGGLPADNVIVNIKLPKIFQFIECENEHYGKIPTIPQKPEPPKQGLAAMMDISSLSRINSFDNFRMPMPNVHGPWIEFTEDNDSIFMEITISKLKHHLYKSFKCTAGLLSLEHAGAFELEYVIMADNMPQKIEDKIPFLFGQG